MKHTVLLAIVLLSSLGLFPDEGQGGTLQTCNGHPELKELRIPKAVKALSTLLGMRKGDRQTVGTCLQSRTLSPEPSPQNSSFL